MTTAPLTFTTDAADDGDEIARADLYGLLARLWLAPPDAALLQGFAVAVTEAPEPGGSLEAPWMALVHALRTTTEAEAAREHASLFHGVGKPEVFVNGSYYLTGSLNEKPLAALRSDLAALGLGRDEARIETEDHVAYVFEVMRWLIAGDDVAVCNLEQQRRFFRTHVQPWVGELCRTTSASPNAQTWRAVADFTAAFVEIESQAFDLLES